MANKRNVLITILIVVIVVMAAILVYAFVIQPGITGYAVDNYNQGIEFTIATIISQIQQNGFVQIPVGNQTLILVPAPPTQQAPQQ